MHGASHPGQREFWQMRGMPRHIATTANTTEEVVMKIEIILTGTSPLLCHNPRMVDPDFELNRQLKALTAKRKKTDEDMKQIERLEWYGGLYEQNGVVVQPTSKVRKCIINAAKISKQGKSIERALSLVRA